MAAGSGTVVIALIGEALMLTLLMQFLPHERPALRSPEINLASKPYKYKLSSVLWSWLAQPVGSDAVSNPKPAVEVLTP
jgi:hypothetical protein